MRTEMTGRVDADWGTETLVGESVRATASVDLSTTSDANMAWLLAIAADACLTGHDRMMTFVELGSGEASLAIQRILTVVMSSQMALPVAIVDRLTRWLDGYVGAQEEPRLRSMLAQIQAQQFRPVSLRLQRARRQRATASAYSVSTVCRKHA
jgi:hypothetical protein